MNLLVSLRGTHGSGKSHLVRQLLERYDAQPTDVDKKGRPNNYVMTLSNGDKLFVVGSYVNACGGCDGIQPYSLIWPRVAKFAELGHVLFEGALVSSSYGNIGRSMESYGDRAVFAFLDTPLQVCLDRIQQRRLAKGNIKPLDPKNTIGKMNSCNGTISKIRDVFHRRVVVLDYRKALPQLLGLFYSPKDQ